MIKIKKILQDKLYLQIVLGILIGSVCYILDSIIKENLNFLGLFLIITLLSYYLQKNILYPLININNDNISTYEWFGNSAIVSIHALVFWTILLNIF